MPHFTKRYWLVVLVGLVSVFALVLVGRWLNATKVGGQQPAEPFRIAGNFYYVGASDVAASGPGAYKRGLNTAARPSPCGGCESRRSGRS